MTINFSIDVQPHQVNSLLTALAGVLDKSPTISTPATTVDPLAGYKRSEPEKAVKPAPVNTEKAVKQTEAPAVTAPVKDADPAPTANAPSYTITTIRAKAKEVAGTKGNEFIREALQHVGASSLSKIPEDKFTEFMDFLTGGDE